MLRINDSVKLRICWTSILPVPGEKTHGPWWYWPKVYYSLLHRPPNCDIHGHFCLIFGNIAILTNSSTLISKIITVANLKLVLRWSFGAFHYDVTVQIRSFLSFPYFKFNRSRNAFNFTALFKNMRTLKFKSRLHNCVFRCRQSWLRQNKTDPNPPITNHKPWPFEPFKVKFCFLRGPLRWLTAAKNTIVSWLLNFRIRMFVKSAVNTI